LFVQPLADGVVRDADTRLPRAQVAYLKEENRILRARLPERLVATDQEKRRLLRFGKELGQQLKEDRPGESGPGMGLRKWGGGQRSRGA
jgi:hypothetical protein